MTRRPDHRRPGAAPEHRPPARIGLDEHVVPVLLAAVGRGELDALGARYDRTAPLVFGLLRGALGARRAAEATERVYLRVWRGAPAFDPAHDSACTLLLRATRRELVPPVHEAVAGRRR